ncbi:MAG: FAD-dependent monooxygenase [Thermosynechococcaceae cyanobacterium]
MNPAKSVQHAIVIGGSVTGLLATRVLSQYFAQVTLIERDPLSDRPESRKGQSHTRHLHALLATGKAVLDRYFPDLIESLHAGGAVLADMAQAPRWHIFGGYRIQYESGLIGILMSRPFLESQIRDRVRRLPNVTVLDGTTVEDLVATPDRSQITGVRIQRAAGGGSYETLNADWVVDASGRGSASPRWLETLGYAKPPETKVTVGVGYATRLYRRQPNDLPHAQVAIVAADPPHCQHAGMVFPIEGDRWIATLVSWGGEQPPLDEQGFLAFAQNLSAPDVYQILSRAEPLSEIVGYKFPASLRRHYEKLARFPGGYLIMGDALCSFDPAYGQGMTSAALQATALDDLLQMQPDLQKLAPRFFKKVAKIVDIPWQLAVGEDFRFPETQGKKAFGTDWLNAYVALVHRATHTDPIVYGALLKVMNLMESPTRLLHPAIVWRVLRANVQAKVLSKNDEFSNLRWFPIPKA